MKPKLLLTLLCGTTAAFFLLLQPDRTHAAEPADAPAVTAALITLQAQQATLLANQEKIDTQIAVIQEELRQARIFVSRGGQAK